MKAYIDFNTSMRMQAKSEFEKDFFKLMNNSVFGKTMENLRKRTDIRLVHNAKTMKKLCAKPSFKTFKIFNSDLAGVHLMQTKIVLNRPIYVGASVLDLSKVLMYDFHYNYMREKYNTVKLLFTDTDSLCYEVHTDDIYHDMSCDMNLFDTSDYPVNHILFSTQNKKVIGKMKDETKGVPIEEFVGLRAKMYSMYHGGKETKTAKGIKKCESKRLRHANYRDCLLNGQVQMCSMNQFRSFNHKMYTISQSKVGLSPYDDKRYVMNNGRDTLAHGHYKTM